MDKNTGRMFKNVKYCYKCAWLAHRLDKACYVCGFCGKAIDDLGKCPMGKGEDNMLGIALKEERRQPTMSELVCRLLDEKKDLFKRKALQYGIGDELANFRDGAAAMQLNPESLDDCFQALKGYCNKHVSFVQRSRKLNDKVDESLGDIAVYALIAQAMWRMKKGE